MRRRTQSRAIEVSGPDVPRWPRVSVAMVTYNHEEFVERAIDSVLEQQAPFAWELIIGEDCSTDRTREIVLRYRRKYPSLIRVLLQPANTRGVDNTDDVYRACRGEYVAELEGDDYWIDPRKLQDQVALMDATPAAFLCGARAYVLHEGRSAPAEIHPADPMERLQSFGSRELLTGAWWFRTCTKVFRRAHLQSVPRHLQDDWAATLWLAATSGFAPTCFLDRVVAVYRQHAGGVWTSMPLHRRMEHDVRVLLDLLPLVNGWADVSLRATLEQRLEALSTSTVTSPDTVRLAARALLRHPRSPAAWRTLGVQLQKFCFAIAAGQGLRQ